MPQTFKQLKFRILDTPAASPSNLAWTLNREHFVVQFTAKNGLKTVKYYLDDILSVKTAAADAGVTGLELLMYPLNNKKRTRTRALISGNQLEPFSAVFVQNLKLINPPHLPRNVQNRRALVLINPFSGQKKALNLYNEFSKPVFLDAGIETEMRYTKHQNHATEIMQTLDIDRYEFVAVVSGDGLINEVVTGLMTRADRARALKLPILHIPGGTGNAMAAAVAFKASEPFSPRGGFCKEMTLMAARPAYHDLRLNHFESDEDGHKCMFMSAVWGLIADIDICSERWRWVGMIRLHIEAVIRIMQLPTTAKYRGRISYIPVEDDELIRRTRLRFDAARGLFGKGHFSSGVTQPFEGEPPADGPVQSVEDSFKDRHSVEIPALKDPVPADWTTIDGEFVYASVSTISHLGSDLPYMPVTRLEEEVLYLTVVDWKVVKNRFQVAFMFTFMEHGAHQDYSCFHIIPVRACRFEPARDVESFGPGCVTVDGEPCSNSSRFQVVASSLCATVVSRNPRDS